MYTTFKELHENAACTPSYRKLAKSLGGVRGYGRETPIPLSKILDICGIEDCFWVLRRLPLTDENKRDLRLLACDFAESTLSIFESEHPDDKRPRKAIRVSRQYAIGGATKCELAAAWDAARDAAWAAAGAAAWAAAWDAARDAETAKQCAATREVLTKWEQL